MMFIGSLMVVSFNLLCDILNYMMIMIAQKKMTI